MLDKALKIATKAHEGQLDKSGADYILHPIAVADMCNTDDEKIVALLHDVVEDTDVTLPRLRISGFSNDVVNAIDCITKREGEIYDDYLKRVASNELSKAVKINDMKHNSDLGRYKSPTDANIKRNEKYKKKLELLLNM